MPRPIFYSGTQNASSWAMRAWLALKFAGVEFDEVIVDIRRPQRFANLHALARRSPSATVPLLIVDDRSIFDSTAIMEFANDACGGSLLPTDLVARAEARSLLAWQHAGLSQICRRISFESAFYPLKRALTVEERREALHLFDVLDQLLAASGGPFLFGAPSLADLSLAPTVIRLTRHDFSPRQERCRHWADHLLADRYVREWMEIADALPHIWYDEYLPAGQPKAVWWDRLT